MSLEEKAIDSISRPDLDGPMLILELRTSALERDLADRLVPAHMVRSWKHEIASYQQAVKILQLYSEFGGPLV